jgi:hypothetical protein
MQAVDLETLQYPIGKQHKGPAWFDRRELEKGIESADSHTHIYIRFKWRLTEAEPLI